MQTLSPMNVPAFITPLPRHQLFQPSLEFPQRELTRRVLSVFWQDCCVPLQFSRAPAPVIEYLGSRDENRAPTPVRAWWLLEDGILEECGGPASERLRPYLNGADAFRLWPRYEFQVSTAPFEVLLVIHSDALTQQTYRICLDALPFERVRVLSRDSL